MLSKSLAHSAGVEHDPREARDDGWLEMRRERLANGQPGRSWVRNEGIVQTNRA